MTHFYERNIVEIKKEYTTFLINILTPFMYEGLRSVYNYAIDTHKKFLEKSRGNPNVVTPGILKIFQTSLREIPMLNNHAIEMETQRIKEKSKCSEWFDDLIKAVIKSNIVLLTFSTAKQQSDIVNDRYHEKVDAQKFIHKCYIECARSVYNNPELFWHGYPKLEIKRNQRETCRLIKKSIKKAIREMLPMKLIISEYLKNEYIPESDTQIHNKMSDSQYINVKSMVEKDLYGADISPQDLDQPNLLDDPESVLREDRDVIGEKVQKILSKVEQDEDDGNGFEEIEDDLQLTDINREVKDLENKITVEGIIEDAQYKKRNKDQLPAQNMDGHANINDPTQKIPLKEIQDEIKHILKKDNIITHPEMAIKKRNNKNADKIIEDARKSYLEELKNGEIGDTDNQADFFKQYKV